MREFSLDTIRAMIAYFEPERTGDVFLDSRYEWQKNENGAEWPYYRFFYQLAHQLRPNLVVELGGYQGTAAAHFAAGQRLGNPTPGLTVTIDHHTDPGDEHNQAKMEEAARRYDNLIYIRGWTTDELAESQRGHHALGDAPSAYQTMLKYHGKIDILFVDSWHVYEYAMADWEAYRPLLSSPALVICDDIMQGTPGTAVSGMIEFWESLPGEKFLNGDLHPGLNMGFLRVA